MFSLYDCLNMILPIAKHAATRLTPTRCLPLKYASFSPPLPRYHVQCDPGQLLHFLIASFSTENRYRSTCLDSVTFDRSAYGTRKVVCGSLMDIGADVEDFNDGRLFVEFCSNRVVQDRGFYVAVTCVRPQFYNQPLSIQVPPLQDFGFNRRRSAPPPPPPPPFQPLKFVDNPSQVGKGVHGAGVYLWCGMHYMVWYVVCAEWCVCVCVVTG